ncbi:MAG TPA: NAD(P)H-binding protein [Casimicrobiaceae bacterium]|nr:NAD(P)H-binding protein [Casimicrobiaceae bacterium]
MDVNRPASKAAPRRAIGKLGRPRLLIVGCGDIGLRIVARLHRRFRIVALTSSPQRVPLLRAAGAVPVIGNLDDRATLTRLRGFSARVIHLAPPSENGDGDRRTLHLVSALGRRDDDRSVYISTTGVYGDTQGAWIDETARLATNEPRSLRRIAAERLMRTRRRAHVLRVPGIYAHDRLPLARLQQKLPALAPDDDVYTSHIHADDLARVAIVALLRGGRCRVTNTVDDSGLKMGEYFDLVADRFGLERPPRLARDALKQAVSPMMYSFMSASRRIRNRRLKRELRVRLDFPTVADALARIRVPNA